MGQHKTNSTAIKVANGEIPPKPPKMSKAKCNKLLYSICSKKISLTITKFVKEKEVNSKTQNE